MSKISELEDKNYSQFKEIKSLTTEIEEKVQIINGHPLKMKEAKQKLEDKLNQLLPNFAECRICRQNPTTRDHRAECMINDTK